MLVEYRNNIWYPAVAAQLVEHFPLLEFIRITQKPNPNNRYSMCHLGAPVLDSASLLLSSLSRLHVLETTLESIKAETSPGDPSARGRSDMISSAIHQDGRGGGHGTQRKIRVLKKKYHDSTLKADLSQVLVTQSIFQDQRPSFRTWTGREPYLQVRAGRMILLPVRRRASDTLYFRLDNGLGQLASLTKLEYLSFESMDHRMGTADIEWFASHLPRLKEMRGLVMENHVGMEPDPENDALVALIRRLRPDVAQRETFSGSISNVPQKAAPRFSVKTRNAT
ncbi:hypothetical protein K457DRAFT_14824 [Linnemannia elongata AG-77]|uniref:Uncharacterized protein n=1 Tax=Linnemannia elongata AG-77 TaxID=1314771 RepID=A0A197KB35_9FUNG|nr:hypothetical protein K457DRAFT_14824 [Linnemannia elongata AG-77]